MARRKEGELFFQIPSEIIESAKGKEDTFHNDAWQMILQQMYEHVLPYLSNRTEDPQEAEDLLAATYVRVFRNISTYKEKERFGPWVFRIARNLAYNHFRDKEKHAAREAIYKRDLPVQSEDPKEWIEEHNPDLQELYEKLKHALLLLPQKQREAIIYHHIFGMKSPEIAVLMGKTNGAVKLLIMRGIQKLRQYFSTPEMRNLLENSGVRITSSRFKQK